MTKTKHSCGAILYSYHNNELGIILGDEGFTTSNQWLPFKGCADSTESHEVAAIREISEETCNLVKLRSVTLAHAFATKRKYYHIGLAYANIEILDKFDSLRAKENRDEFLEKKKLRFFPLKNIYENKLHSISMSSIKYYMRQLLFMKTPGKSLISHAYSTKEADNLINEYTV